MDYLKNKKILMTGATGNIGSDLLATFLNQGGEVFCLIRSRNDLDAQERLDSRLRTDWVKLKIVNGDITKSYAGVSDDDIKALSSEMIDIVFHCAGSIKFDKEAKDETRKINVEGTKNVIALASKIGAKKFHHMSTAYVAGDAEIFGEDDLDIGQHFRNPYEKTKKEAEEVLRRTLVIPYSIYRPSVIVGETETGRINSFDGFYLFLKILWRFKQHLRTANFFKRLKMRKIGRIDLNGDLLLPLNICCSGETTLNIIPLDWLADTLVKLMNIPASNQTYHLVHQTPPTIEWLFEQSLKFIGVRGITLDRNKSSTKFPASLSFLNRAIETLLPYMQHETKFKTGHLQEILGFQYQPPPSITEGYIEKIMSFAVKNNFSKRNVRGFRNGQDFLS